MRLLHIADVHLERPFKRLGPRRGRERRAELKATLRRVVDVARARRVDALCIAGDLFERENAPPSVGAFLRASLADLADVPILIAPGNHDFLSPGCLYDQVSWPANVHVFRTATPSPVTIGDGTVWGCGFTGPERHQSPLADFVAPPDGSHVGLFHADVADDSPDSVYAPLKASAIVASGLRFAMLGHVHSGRIDEQRRFAYPGSLEPLDISELGPRGAILLDVSNGDLRVDWIPVAQRRVLVDEIDITSIATIADFQKRLADDQVDWEHADVKLRLVGALTGELVDPEAIRSALSEVDVDLEIVARPEEDFVGLARQNTTLGAFVRDVQSRLTSADDDQRRYWSDVLRVGVAAFRGHEVTLS